jgi:hypothetical protein
MKYISECCKAEAIIRNNDISLCSKCREECDVLDRVELKQTEEQKNFSFMIAGLFDADAYLKLQPISDLYRSNIKLESLITIY